MDYYDVLFPVNIGPLTYRCPDSLSERARPGTVISAPLKNTVATGIILKKMTGEYANTVKDILAVHDTVPILSSGMIRLLQWMSDYYIAEQGLVLKNILPKAILTTPMVRRPRAVKPRQIQTPTAFRNHLDEVPVDGTLVNTVRSAISTPSYRTFLLCAHSARYADAFLLKCIAGARNGIILVPEISSLHKLYDLLVESFGQRICLYHGELGHRRRRETFQRILSQQSDIVLGTRSAVFAPLKKISFLAVLGEHSTSYKQESSPCYNGRDVAVMRGYFEKCTVLLSSISPSIESLFNCEAGKYTLLKPQGDSPSRRVKIIDMRYEKQIKPYISKTVIDSATKHLKEGGRIMIAANRRGYATLLECPDCNYVEECPVCKIPLVFHKQDMSMKCHYCGFVRAPAPELCSKCSGHRVRMLGSGTQRIQEDIEHILGEKGFRLDSDTVGKKSAVREKAIVNSPYESRILIGTKMITRRLNSDPLFSMAAMLNADSLLNLPDFRSTERAYQEIRAVMDMIESGGEILIQTNMPQHYVFKSLKANDPSIFVREELLRRKPLLYPPFSRLTVITCISGGELSNALVEKIRMIDGDCEALGPSVSKNKKGYFEYTFLLKSPHRSALHATAKSIVGMLRTSRNVRVRADVDPQVI